jgi:hypothetical protein
VKCLSGFILYLKVKSLTAVVGQVVTERHVYLLFNRDLDNGHCDDLLAEGRERLFRISKLC